MAKKQSSTKKEVTESVEPTESNIIGEVAAAPIAPIAPINHEIRLAETKPGEIEQLEEDLDVCQASLAFMEEQNLIQEDTIRRQQAQINFLAKRDGFWLDQMILLPAVYHTNDAFKAAPISFLRDTIVDYEASIDKAMEIIKAQHAQVVKATTEATHSSGLSRKDQILRVMLPDGINSIPGPHVTISRLAVALGTNNKNVSSMLTAVRDAGYSVATDDLGRKFILSYTAGVSKKHIKYVDTDDDYSDTDNTTDISPDQLTASISAAAGTVVKRTSDGTISRVN